MLVATEYTFDPVPPVAVKVNVSPLAKVFDPGMMLKAATMVTVECEVFPKESVTVTVSVPTAPAV